MTQQQDLALKDDTHLPGLAFPAMRMVVLKQARDNNLRVIEDCDNRITLQLGNGQYSFSSGQDGIDVQVSSDRA